MSGITCNGCVYNDNECVECCPDCWCASCCRRGWKDVCSLGTPVDKYIYDENEDGEDDE